ncbi:MAG: cytochrome b [Gammaproteobacteria bacterium]|nr:cytochrome b [Gammaproteobacteria bacterium]NKB63186.1 cytochrome b [Gammaproteobacteria bacterium]
MIRNSKTSFGWLAIVIHWLIALTVVGQFVLGLYMVSLNYYHPNYQILPYYHKSIGILFAMLLLFRIFWSLINKRPGSVPGVRVWEHWASVIVQWAMNLLLVVVVCMGYLISTATGDSISVFDWFEVPATITSIDHQEDWAGEMHYWFALSVMILAGLHGLAALKHHFLDKDQTLNRMIGGV